MSTQTEYLAGPRGSRGAADQAAPRGRLRCGDPVFRVIATACGLAVAVAMFGLAAVLIFNSWPAITGLGTKVLTTVDWAPSMGHYGALAALAGTALSTIVAMVIAVPLALVIALLLVELVHPTVGKVVGMGIEMLAAIPSIIFGMVGPLRHRAVHAGQGRALARRVAAREHPGHQARADLPGRRPEHPHRRHRPRLHDPAVHHGGLARRAAHGARR